MIPEYGYGWPISSERKWPMHAKSRTFVDLDPENSDKIRIQIEGDTCDVVGYLYRDDARILAKRIIQCLDDTEVDR